MARTSLTSSGTDFFGRRSERANQMSSTMGSGFSKASGGTKDFAEDHLQKEAEELSKLKWAMKNVDIHNIQQKSAQEMVLRWQEGRRIAHEEHNQKKAMLEECNKKLQRATEKYEKHLAKIKEDQGKADKIRQALDHNTDHIKALVGATKNASKTVNSKVLKTNRIDGSGGLEDTHNTRELNAIRGYSRDRGTTHGGRIAGIASNSFF
eukprot:gnl/MRDRNA2_/MRDRNA2_91492_c0_seq1.p1 gnl/MRDRNA2_/MRDRNA2_91492_c0~~gnl/MRDRNA2_/MRDRNA2_91492_c0_seq1.p1  ORF type:complete len:208 (+),score=44.15 gnl/MRDRNA2_/MRDRNA2_91492_c0_seq1:129-752(+)